MSKKLTHFNEAGDAEMVDVSEKASTHRIATATSKVLFPSEVYSILKENGFNTKKGSLIQIAVLAGIAGVKQTAQLIPLCHNIPISKADVKIEPVVNGFDIYCTVKTVGQTGVEMEALTGASTAALCIYDMCKALSHDIVIGPTQLAFKTGGKRDFKRA
jgi:cyclic pyranopterin phosphate synthase